MKLSVSKILIKLQSVNEYKLRWWFLKSNRKIILRGKDTISILPLLFSFNCIDCIKHNINIIKRE